MKKALTRIEMKVWHVKDGKKVEGVRSGIRGDVSDISGYVSYIRGDVSGISGYVTDISGDVSGIRGDVSGIRGDVDECKITAEERKKGINIKDLIKLKPKGEEAGK